MYAATLNCGELPRIIAAFRDWDFRTKYEIGRAVSDLWIRADHVAKCIASSHITIDDAKFIHEKFTGSNSDITKYATSMTSDAYEYMVAAGFVFGDLAEHLCGEGRTKLTFVSNEYICLPSLESRPWITDPGVLQVYALHSITPWSVLEERMLKAGGSVCQLHRLYHLCNPHVDVKEITRDYFEEYVRDIDQYENGSDDS